MRCGSTRGQSAMLLVMAALQGWPTAGCGPDATDLDPRQGGVIADIDAGQGSPNPDSDNGSVPDGNSDAGQGLPDGNSDAGLPRANFEAGPHWPTQRTALPPCSAAKPAFVTPALRGPSGTVSFQLNARLQPVGYDVRIDIEVRDSNTGQRDTTATGRLSLALANNVVLAAPVDVTAGKAQAVVRFLAPGTFGLSGSLEDGRSGSIEIAAYAPQIPVWELSVDDAAFAGVLAKPHEATVIDAFLTLHGTPYTTRLRLHGGSSRDYPKKSLRLDLAAGQALPDGSEHLILRSEWNDKTLLRSYLSSELFRNATWVPTYETEHVHVRINQRYYGVMVHAERVDKDWLRRRGLRTTGSLYEPDPPRTATVPGGNLTPLESRESYPIVYQHHAGNILYDDLIEFIEEKLTLPEETFQALVPSLVAVDEYLAYLAMMAVVQNHDNIRKNYYLYRDPAGDRLWHVFPWDLDLTWGHLYTDEHDVLDETIFTDESLFFGERVPEHGGFQNELMTRILRIETYRAQFVEFVRHIEADAFNETFVNERIDNVLCRATPDILADTNKRATNGEYPTRVEELLSYLRQRRAYIDRQR